MNFLKKKKIFNSWYFTRNIVIINYDVLLLLIILQLIKDGLELKWNERVRRLRAIGNFSLVTSL